MRIKQLDLLRGLAILLVRGQPPVIKRPETGQLGLFGSMWQRFGWTGVDLFFVLSGFLIGGLLFAEFKRTSSLNTGRFLIRRGFRIWPGYLALLASTSDMGVCLFGRFRQRKSRWFLSRAIQSMGVSS
jgi:peptidoglycan/LPS O-acetylase OafA/YrhL